MDPVEIFALLFTGLGMLMFLIAWATLPEVKYTPIRCAVHKWILMDETGTLPYDAPQSRKLNATLMCAQCGKLPRKREDGEL